VSSTAPIFVTPRGVGFARLLEFPARIFPDKTALIDDSGSVTFGEADRMASCLSGAFRAAGAATGDRIALILPNGNPFVVTEMAIMKGGMVKVPLNIRFHKHEVMFALADCEPTILVCEASYAESVRDELAAVPSLRAVFTIGGVPEGLRSFEQALTHAPATTVPYAPEAPILIRYTGGTTGRAKGIVHTEESFLACNLDVVREFAFRDDDVVVHVGHLSHGMNFMWAAMYAVGATQILHEKFEPLRVLADIERYRATFIYMVPTMLHRLLHEDDGKRDVSSLRQFLYGSAPMPVPLLRQAIARYGQIFMQVYTLSESPVVTTLFRASEHVERETIAGPRLASCGREVLTMEVRLLDDEGREVPAGDVGEIAIRSINNMAGYWNRPAETAATLVNGWVITGDMARRDEEGYLYVVDRKKDMIITGALNVYPKEVEDVLHAHPAVSQAVVIGIADDEWGEIIRAYVVPKPGAHVTEAIIVEHCLSALASYKKPRQVRIVDSLPLSPIGKVNRVALREQARAECAAS
jgi:acyl-CoA synthetase (AMP-forming)/AMP-acid ligase II